MYGQYPHLILKSLGKSSYAPGETVELKYEILNNGLAAWPVDKVRLQKIKGTVLNYECNSNQTEVHRNKNAVFTLKLQLADTLGSHFANFGLCYDDKYCFGGDVIVYYTIKAPVVLTAAEAELQELVYEYNPAIEIEKAITLERVASEKFSKVSAQADKKTEALVSTTKECKTALQRYDELMSQIDGYTAQQLQLLRDQQKVGESKSKSESEETESDEDDQESDEDDEDPVMMQDWTKRV